MSVGESSDNAEDVSKSSAIVHDPTTDIEDDGAASIEERDFKQKQVFKGWLLFWLAYQSTGAIYGDIGTSPLYVFSSTFSAPPEQENLLGALSLIIWTITLIVSIKYVFIILSADDEGEGGTFALYSLLSRYCNINNRDPKSRPPLKFQRHDTEEMKTVNLAVRSWLENSRFASGILKALAVFGVSLVMADGVLTPAQSVLGAIQGLKVADPSVDTPIVVGVSCAIIVLLYLAQPLGITKLSSAFAPIVIIWLLFNSCFGIYNLTFHDASVFQAFAPWHAIHYFIRLKREGWLSLGGILLSFTGVEALFADMGAFSKRAIQLSWLFFAYPCLLLTYIGQAAYIMDEPQAYSNPFFLTVPPGMYWPSLIIAILAAIVASQAIITAVFQLLAQVMNMSYFPQVKVIHSSSTFHGQVYIPFANWLLMIGTVLVTAIYNNTQSLGHAYGVCVILVTFITTNLVLLVALIVWRLNPILVFAVWLPFVTLDGLYLSSAVVKLPDGSWFTLLLAVVLSTIFILWRYGKGAQWKAENLDRVSPSRLVQRDPKDPNIERLSPALGGGTLTSIKGLGIFFDKAGEGVPAAYLHFLQKFEARPEVHVFLHLRALYIPTVSEDEKYTVTIVSGINRCFRVTARYGYNDQIVTKELGSVVYTNLRRFLIRSSKSFRATPPVVPPEEIDAERASTSSGPAAGTNDEQLGPESLSPKWQFLSATDQLAQDRMREFKLAAFPLATFSSQEDEQTAALVVALDKAYATQTVYIVGKQELRVVRPTKVRDARTLCPAYSWSDVCGQGALRRIVLTIFLWARENTRPKVASMKIPVEKLIEVGFVKEI